MKILFIGGTGNISTDCAALLHQRGHEISVVTRGHAPVPAAYRAVQADRRDRAALAGIAADVVINFLGYDLPDVETDHAVFAGYVAVHQFCRIGQMAIIGGCSKVRQDVPPFMLADGNPARVRTINKVGLERNGLPEPTQAALRQAYKILFRDGLNLPNATARIEAELPALPELAHLVEFVRASERGICR